MENKCKLVIDLLPTYIEKLTSQDTNNFIEQHLKECENCKKAYTEMTSDLDKEELENTEIVKKIKSYKIKLLFIRLLIFIIILCFLFPYVKDFLFRYYVVSNTLERNINYDLGDNYTIEEYIDSIERFENHITTYYLSGKMKKVYGDKVLEYYDGKDHYYFNNDDKTYFVEKDVELDDNLNIPIQIFENRNFNNNFIDKIKFILDKNITIRKEGFRDEEFYCIFEGKGTTKKIYFDKDTFIADRVINKKSEEYKEEEQKEFRITQSDVSYRLVQAPDFSLYKQVEK